MSSEPTDSEPIPDGHTVDAAPSTSSIIDSYIGGAVAASVPYLRAMATVIREEAHEANERISYGIPTWHIEENLVHIAGYARHVGLYPGSAAMVAFADEFGAYVTSKGAVQFPLDRPLPLDLVRRVVRWRLDAVRAEPRRESVTRRRALHAGSPEDDLLDPGPIEFVAVLHRSDASGAACFVDFPHDLKAIYGKGNLVPVRAIWDHRVDYRGSLAKMGGELAMLLCRKDVLAELAKGAGDTVHVTVTLDREPREVEVPSSLEAALDANDGARVAWDALSPSSRREYAHWIDEAKREATRESRVAKAIPMILARKRLKG